MALTSISMNYKKSISFIDRYVARLCEDKDIPRAIRRAKFLGEVLWKNSCGIHELSRLEHHIVESLMPILEDIELPVETVQFGHVLTKAYDTGGHTRVVERLVQTVSLNESGVVVTEKCNSNAFKRLSVARYGVNKLDYGLTGLSRINCLLQAFKVFDVLILYIHPYDIEAVVAAGVVKRIFGTTVLFYNHADHVFSFGYGVADRVLEISHFGWELRGKRGIEEKSTFVGIPLGPGIAKGNHKSRISNETPAVITTGSGYKYRPDFEYSFPLLVSNFVRWRDCKFVIIGVSFFDWWWIPLRFLRPVRVRLMRRVDHEMFSQLIDSADLYVDSFPVIGGTALPEVFCRGIECFGLYTGSHGYSPVDYIRSLNVEQLVGDITKYLDDGTRSYLNTEIFDLVKFVHDPVLVSQRILKAVEVKDGISPPPWKNRFSIEVDYYLKRWQKRRFITVPVHVFPEIGFLFILQLYKIVFYFRWIKEWKNKP